MPQIAAEKTADAFVPYPAFLTQAVSWQQIVWQQHLWAQTWFQAWAARNGPKLIHVRAADLPRAMRN